MSGAIIISDDLVFPNHALNKKLVLAENLLGNHNVPEWQDTLFWMWSSKINNKLGFRRSFLRRLNVLYWIFNEFAAFVRVRCHCQPTIICEIFDKCTFWRVGRGLCGQTGHAVARNSSIQQTNFHRYLKVDFLAIKYLQTYFPLPTPGMTTHWRLNLSKLFLAMASKNTV